MRKIKWLQTRQKYRAEYPYSGRLCNDSRLVKVNGSEVSYVKSLSRVWTALGRGFPSVSQFWLSGGSQCCPLWLSMCVGCIWCRSAVSGSLRSLRPRGWLGQQTREVTVRFALFSPPTGLFTGVSLRAQQPVPGVLLPSVSVHSAQVHRTAGAVDYAVMACEVSKGHKIQRRRKLSCSVIFSHWRVKQTL